MRSTRFNKFKSKNLTFMIMLKMALIWYLILFSTSYLTTGTAANFTTNLDTNGTITVGAWEIPDDSNLVFSNKGNQNVKACGPKEIKVKLKNNSKGDMQNDSTYVVHYVKNGNPEKHGVKLTLADNEGKITALKSGATIDLTYTANQPGVYAFQANQTNEDLTEEAIWSKWVIVNCPQEKNIQENDKTEDKKSIKTKQEEGSDEKKGEEKENDPVKEKNDAKEKDSAEKEEIDNKEKHQKAKEVKKDVKEKEKPQVDEVSNSETKSNTTDKDQSGNEQDGDQT